MAPRVASAGAKTRQHSTASVPLQTVQLQRDIYKRDTRPGDAVGEGSSDVALLVDVVKRPTALLNVWEGGRLPEISIARTV